ncbi:hypothetical protein AB3Y40_02805 [Yoonia sp. R2331]|uniref:hypothetical protein n=1 Tax=Yoonia sp. R2331 TaxID=3237238 RepID=UPI0034E37F89
MGHKWIIDVLADLESFAHQNKLPILAAELGKTARVASAEIVALNEGAPIVVHGDAEQIQSLLSRTGTG